MELSSTKRDYFVEIINKFAIGFCVGYKKKRGANLFIVSSLDPYIRRL